jgi:predicted aspartyl protease
MENRLRSEERAMIGRWAFTMCLVTACSAGASAQDTLTAAQIDAVLARAHAASGGAAFDRFVASTVSGSATQGGAPISFTTVSDLRNGYFRQQITIGPATLLEGYDGAQWSLQNGALSVVSLPAYVEDAATQAYLNSNAFLRPEQRSTILYGREQTLDGRPVDVLHAVPKGGSPADLYFDGSSYQLVRVDADQAGGIDTTSFSNYQTIQGVPTAMRSVEVNPEGTKTTTTLTSVVYATTLDPKALARPAYVSHGDLGMPVSVPFQSDDVGSIDHIVVPVTLDGAEAHMYFDSGAANFLVAPAAERLGLKTSGDFAIGGVGSKQQMSRMAAVKVVDFGGARLEKQNFVVTPLLYPLVHPRKGMTVDGLIGYEFLANYRVSIRYADRSIQVAPFDAPAPTAGVTLPFKSDGAHAYVEAAVDGATGYFLLDTGNGGGVDLNGSFVEEHHLFPNGGLTYVSPGGVGGKVDSTLVTAKSVRLAGVNFVNVPVGIVHAKAGAFATRGVAGNLGARILSRFTIVFDYKAETVTFIPNADAMRPFTTDRTGLSLNQTGAGAFEVLGTVAGSPAQNAGIAVNDRITAIGGVGVASGLGLGDVRPYTTGSTPFAVTLRRGSLTKTVTITPRDIAPAPQ